MQIAHARREEMTEIKGVHAGANSIFFKSLFEKNAFQTPWWFIHSAFIPPGGGIGHHRHDHCEELFVIVDNAAQFTHNGRTTEIVGGVAVPLREGESHAIYNHTDKETRFFNFNVAELGTPADSTDFGDARIGVPLESVDRLPIGRLDRNLMTYQQLHGGKGIIGSRVVWDWRDFRNNWGIIVHCLLPADTSIGYHRHDTVEEVYIVIDGNGRITADDVTVDVHPGDAILNRLGGSHGIYNNSNDELEILVVSVCMEKGKLDAIDLGNDLSARE